MDWERAARLRLHANRQKFELLLERVEGLHGRGRLEEASVYAQMAADLASRNPAGLFYSRELEERLREIGSTVTSRAEMTGDDSTWPDSRPSGGRSPRRVLHVITEAGEAGGHTRLLWRWVQNDSSRTHSVAFTAQGTRAVPGSLREAVRAAGGGLFFLDRDHDGLISRARKLRALARQADFLVLHVEPYDVVPVMGLADPAELPPVALMNHADHAFWVGVDVSTLVLHCRESGRRHSVDSRGVEKSFTALLPLPLELHHGERHRSRAAAKARIGCPEDSTVLVSAAWGYKYTPLGEIEFAEVHAAFLEATPEAFLLVVGPDDDARWERQAARVAGRLRVLPATADLSPYFEAMDVYVNSFPIPSLTSALDAALYSVPVVSFNALSSRSPVLHTDDPSFDDIYQSGSVGDYLAHLGQLVSDRSLREEIGGRLAESVVRDHHGEGWLEWLERVYEKGVSLRGRRPEASPGPLPAESELLDLVMVEVNTRAGVARGLQGSIVKHWRLLSPGMRVLAFLRDIILKEPGRGWSVSMEFLRDRLRVKRDPAGIQQRLDMVNREALTPAHEEARGGN